jgi:hypothetical protein
LLEDINCSIKVCSWINVVLNWKLILWAIEKYFWMRTMNIGVLIILTCNLHANEFIETGCMFVSVAWLKSFCTCITFMRAGYMLLSVETVVPLLDNCFCLLWYYLSPLGNYFWQLDICFWETNLRWFLYFLCCVQRRKDPLPGVLIMGIFCTRIPGSNLGSCHSPPQMEQ